MREIILTGYSRKEGVRAKGKVKPRCYLCKRKQDDKWVYAAPEKDGYRYFSTEMGFEWLEIIKNGGADKADRKFKFFICHECALLLEAISERSEMRALSTT